MRCLPFYGSAAAVFVLDQLSKAAAVRALGDGSSKDIIPGCLALTLVHNTGSAFGLLRGTSPFLAMVALAAVGVMVWMERRGLPGRALPTAIGLVLGGALGNLADRVRLGYVVDFVDVQLRGHNVFPVFNVADSAITVGAALVLWYSWRAETSPKQPAKENGV